MNNPLITVVTPSYNQAPFLEKTIKSVLEQDYPNIEYIVMDGGSDDGSVEIIKRYESRIAHWESTRDRGQSHAINKGFEKASGEILCWINSDDYLLPGALEFVSGQLTCTGNRPDWLIGACQIVDADANILKVRKPAAVDRTTFFRWRTDWFPQPSTFWNRALWQMAGELDESLHYIMDLELWQRMFVITAPQITDRELAAFRVHDQGKCVAEPAAAREERVKHRKQMIEKLVDTSEIEGVESLIMEIVNLYSDTVEELGESQEALQRLRKHRVIGPALRAWKRLVNKDLPV